MRVTLEGQVMRRFQNHRPCLGRKDNLLVGLPSKLKLLEISKECTGISTGILSRCPGTSSSSLGSNYGFEECPQSPCDSALT